MRSPQALRVACVPAPLPASPPVERPVRRLNSENLMQKQQNESQFLMLMEKLTWVWWSVRDQGATKVTEVTKVNDIGVCQQRRLQSQFL